MNDETVIYQDNQPSGDHKVIYLNESYKNFQYILFGYFDSNGYLGTKHIPVEVLVGYADIVLGGIVGDGSNGLYVTASINVLSETEFQQRNKKNSYTKIVFIKGINRVVQSN